MLELEAGVASFAMNVIVCVEVLVWASRCTVRRARAEARFHVAGDGVTSWPQRPSEAAIDVNSNSTTYLNNLSKNRRCRLLSWSGM